MTVPQYDATTAPLRATDDELRARIKRCYPGEAIWSFTDAEIERLEALGLVPVPADVAAASAPPAQPEATP